MRPSSLKQSISLTGCTINKELTKIRSIVLNLTDGNMLCMEAESKELADEWVKVLTETTDILNKKTAAGKTRRINVANEHSDEADATPRQVRVNAKCKLPTNYIVFMLSFLIISSQVVPKSDTTINILESALCHHFLMSSITDKRPVIDALQPQYALPGDVIIWQVCVRVMCQFLYLIVVFYFKGLPGELFYVLESGLVEVVKDNKQVGQIGDGHAFGELALLNSTNRAASIRALSACQLWTLDRKTFRNVLANEELQKKSKIVGLLRNVKLFEKLSDSTLGTVADVIQRVEYGTGEKIIKQGEVCLRLCVAAPPMIDLIICIDLTLGWRCVLRCRKWNSFRNTVIFDFIDRRAS